MLFSESDVLPTPHNLVTMPPSPPRNSVGVCLGCEARKKRFLEEILLPLGPEGQPKSMKVQQKALPGRAGSPSGKGPRFSSLRGLPRTLKTLLFLKENHSFQRVRPPAKGLQKGTLKARFCVSWGASGAGNASKGPSRRRRGKQTGKKS